MLQSTVTKKLREKAMGLGVVRLKQSLTLLFAALSVSNPALAGDVEGFIEIIGDSITKNSGFPDNFDDGKVSSAFFLNGLGPSVLTFDVSPVSGGSTEPDQLFFLAFVNQTGHELERIDVRLGVIMDDEEEEKTVAQFSENFGSFFGTVDPVLQPSFFFPIQTTDPINPITHGGVAIPSWPIALPATLHFGASILNTDHELALWVDVTPVPEPVSGLVLAALVMIMLTTRHLRHIKHPHWRS